MARTKKTNPDDSNPPHLPVPWLDQVEYDRFCKLVNPYMDYTEADRQWKEIRIRANATAEEVYHRLPSDMDLEYGGYLTKSRIRYVACDPRQAWVPQSKTCTFHSHPTKIQNAEPDVPSAADIRHFLLGRHWRTITVGRFSLWVWDKTEQTRQITRKFWKWETNNMTREVDRLMKAFPDGWEREYVNLAIGKLGVRIPENTKRWGRIWPERLKAKLGLKVIVLERNGEVTQR